ncbi:MAG: hemerythrin domain-containing protein [Dehalococcoidales bacterium]|nr:hemerythrin domain-containing protein [Dehalococcoidales bacterium]
MSATEELKKEHRVIERVLTIIGEADVRESEGKDLPAEFFPKIIDFIRNFADRCHHGKEEDNLFPAMEQRGIPRQDGPVAIMLMEHDEGRGYVRGLDEAAQRLAAGDKGAMREAMDNALDYAGLLRQHIEKEDNILYRMADQALTAADQQQLLERFEEVERERLGEGKHEEYLTLVADLERELGIS